MKRLVIAIVVLGCSLSLHAQKDKHQRSEEFKALQIAYITEKLELTPEESQQFWPIHNQYERAHKELRNAHHNGESKELTEAEAKQSLQEMLARDQEKLKLKQAYLADLQKVIPAQKIVKLFEVEHDFKRKMLKNIRETRKEKRH